jgi:hypothetical protein
MTTLNQIRSHYPCSSGWTKLLKHLGKTAPDDEPLSLLTVLESNGLNDAVWCLCTEPTPERTQRFALAVARRVEHLSAEAKALNDTTEQYLNGTVTREELDAASCNPTALAFRADRLAYAATVTNPEHCAWLSHMSGLASDNYANQATERQAQAQLFKEIFA